MSNVLKYEKVLIHYIKEVKRPYMAFVLHFGESLCDHEDEVIESIKLIIPIQTSARSMAISRMRKRIRELKKACEATR